MEGSLAQSGNARAEGKRSNLNVLNFCVCLLEAAGDGQAWNPARSGGAAELFFLDGGNDRSFVHQGNGRVAAKGPDAEGEHRLSVPRSSISFEAKQAQNRTWKPALSANSPGDQRALHPATDWPGKRHSPGSGGSWSKAREFGRLHDP